MSAKPYLPRPRLCLLIAAVGLITLGSSQPQALAGWRVGGVELKSNESVAAEVHPLKKDKKKHHLITVLPVLGKVLCKEFHVTVGGSGSISLTPSVNATFQIQYLGCDTYDPKENLISACKPKEPIKVGGKGHLILHNARNYFLFEPEAEGKAFTTIEFGELCALAETGKITGSLVAECLNTELEATDCATEAVHHLIQPAPAALFPSDTLKFGASAATFEGITDTWLSGANTGKNWSGTV